MTEARNVIAKDTEASAMPHGAAAAASVNNGGIIVMAVAISAVLMLGVVGLVSGYALSRAEMAISIGQKAENEARIEQSKTESLRNEVSELRGQNEGRPKEK